MWCLLFFTIRIRGYSVLVQLIKKRFEEGEKNMKVAASSNVNMSKSMYVGAGFLLLSALLTSTSQVYYANQVQGVHPFLFTGISFFITA